MRVYEGSVLLYGLARQRGRTPGWSAGRQILADVYQRALEHSAADPKFKWFIVWPHESARFATLLHKTVAERYVAEGRAVQRAPMPVFEARGAAGPTSARFQVGPAHDDELELFVTTLAKTRPTPYVEAHDFVAGRVRLEATTREWREAGLERERGAFSWRARTGGRSPIAVLEAASAGCSSSGCCSTSCGFSRSCAGR